MQLDNYVHGVDTVFSVRGLTKRSILLENLSFGLSAKRPNFKANF